MAVNTKTEVRPYSEVHIDNQSFDAEFQTSVTQPLGYDGVNLQRQDADNMALKIVNDGTYDYIGMAAPGTATGTAKWKVMRIDSSGNIAFADGNSNFDNIVTNMASLSYS